MVTRNLLAILVASVLVVWPVVEQASAAAERSDLGGATVVTDECSSSKLENMGRQDIADAFDRVKGARFEDDALQKLVDSSTLNDVTFGYRGGEKGRELSLLVVFLSADNGYVATISADDLVQAVPWAEAEGITDARLHQLIPRAGKTTRAASKGENCPSGYVQTCMKYDFSCVKRIAPGWAEVACGVLPGKPAQIACFVAAAFVRAQDCCTLYGCRADQG